MERGKKVKTASWTAACEVDKLLQEIFDGDGIYHRRKFCYTPSEAFP